MPEMINKIKEMYQYRYILKSLVSKNLIGKYKNSIFGFTWHFITPIILMFVYYVVFTSIRESQMPNFWIYLASGLFPFTFMMSGITGSPNTIISSGGLIKKIYFPREIIVLSQVISNFIILIIGYCLVIPITLICKFTLHLSILYIPIILLIMFLFTLGTTLLLSSITVYIRDLQYLVNSFSIVFFMMTPMYFTTDGITGIMESIVWLNPLTYFIELFHETFYYGIAPDTSILITATLISVFSFIVGCMVFDRLKGKFAEKI